MTHRPHPPTPEPNPWLTLLAAILFTAMVLAAMAVIPPEVW